MKRRWWKWLGIGLLAALLLVGSALAWLLHSSSGLAWALRTGVAAAGGSLSYSSQRGTLADGFTLDAPILEVPGLRISAVELRMRLQWSRLLAAEVNLETLRLTGARYTVLKTDTPPASTSARPGKIDLPVDIVLRNLELLANELDLGGEQPLVFSLAASEIALRNGQLAIDGLALRQGDFALRANAAVDTNAAWMGELETEGEWSLPAVAHRAKLNLSGNLDTLDLRAALQGGGSVSVAANLSSPLDAPGISGRLGAQQLDLSSFGLNAPIRMLDMDLSFTWDAGKFGLKGPLKADERALTLDLVGLEFLPQRLRVERLALGSAEIGTLTLSGDWPTADSGAAGELRANLKGVWANDWRGAIEPVPARIDGDLVLTGHTPQWQAALTGNWTRGEQSGPLQLAVSGSTDRIDIAPSQLALGSSAVALSGSVELVEPVKLALDLALTTLDPALLLPDWPGALDGKLRVAATLGEASTWTLAIEQISGTLRNAPLQFHGSLDGVDAGLSAGDLSGQWGSGTFKLEVPQAQAVALQLQDLDLALLGPWQGQLSGTLATRLDGDVFDLAVADLSLEQLTLNGPQVRELHLLKRSGWNLTVNSRDVHAAGAQLDRFDLTISGSAAAHQIQAQVQAPEGALKVVLAGAFSDPTWLGTLEQLQLTPAHGAPWLLEDTAALKVDGAQVSLAPACLRAAAARLCIGVNLIDGTWATDLKIEAFPLAELNAWAPESDWHLSGSLNGCGALTLDAAGKAGGALQLQVSEGKLRSSDELDQALAFAGTLNFDGAAQALMAQLQLPGHGGIKLRAAGFDQPGGQLQAELDITDLSFVDGLSAEIQSMRGGLRGELQAPLADLSQLQGRLEAAGLSFELPLLGLKATEGSVGLLFEGDGLLRVDGNLQIAPGTLRLEGLVGLGAGQRSQIRIQAANAGLVDLPAVRLAGDTNFLVQRSDEGFSIDGGVLLRSGRIDLDRFAPAVPPSEDVVIEDAPPPPPPLPITANISVAMIQAVDLRGFGLEATLNGGVRVSQVPGKRARAQGEMVVKGAYNAYGQKLDIERGRLGFSGGRADRPSLDILAVKRVDRQRVGVQVRGNAGRPLIKLYSDPTLDQSETLSYLVLGRPLATASGADSEQLGEYASALQTAGGSLVAGSIGKKLGLAAGVESFGSAIGSALVVGKYLSPRFFIGYGTSLLDATQLVILRYRVTENIELEGISGIEQKASISWRTER